MHEPIVDYAPTHYGNQCNSSCSDHCQNKLCNQTTEFCFSCIDTRSGVFCENEIHISQPAGMLNEHNCFIQIDSNKYTGYEIHFIILFVTYFTFLLSNGLFMHQFEN